MVENNRIIIIDDDQSIWKSYQSVLNKSKNTGSDISQLESLLLGGEEPEEQKNTPQYDLYFAQQGEEGYEKLKLEKEEGRPFAIAFIDVRMPPGWNGVETACAIREIDTDVEIVIVTAFSDMSSAEVIKKIGQPENLLYLRKPFDADELTQITLQLVKKWNLWKKQREQQTHIEQLLDELGQTRNYLSSIINSISSILVGVSEEAKITHWNMAAEFITGINRQAALGCIISSIFPDIGSLDDMVYVAIENNENKHLKKLLLTFKEERERIFELNIYPLESDGKKGAVIRLDDITERTSMEEIMVQSDKMLTVGGLAAGMAHEINTPLGSIIQSAQVLSNRLDKNNQKNKSVADELGIDIEKIHDYLENRDIFQLLDSIRESGARTSKIVKSMLSFSHMGANTKPIKVNEVIDEALELAKSDYNLKKRYRFIDFNISFEYAKDIPDISLDRTKLEQVILNLIKNAAHAMEAMPNDHQPSIHIKTNSDENNINIQIKDNGPGIDEDIRKRIFDPFFTTKEVGSGTGLGLSLAYFIINRQHNGSIWVDSTLGEGATFNIQLPLKSIEDDRVADAGVKNDGV